VWIVVGLGNPGARYAATRHNVGFRVLDALVARHGAGAARAAHRALLWDSRVSGERVLLVKPQTFMNCSGGTLTSLRRFYEFATGKTIAVHDDVDLPLGRLRIRVGGGGGGHRGIASLVEALGDPGFVRVKVGVGRPPAGEDTAQYVLAAPTEEDELCLASAAARAAEAVEFIMSAGAESAMNRINQRETVNG